MAVVNVQPFRVIVVAERDGGVVVGCLLRDGVREFSAGGFRAVEDVDEAVAGFLAGDADPDDGGDVGFGEDGLEDEGSDGVDDDDGVGVVGGDGRHEGVAVVPGIEIVAVAGVAFDGDVTFAGVGVDEDEGGACVARCGSTKCRVVGVRECDFGAVSSSLGVDCIVWSCQIWEFTAAVLSALKKLV